MTVVSVAAIVGVPLVDACGGRSDGLLACLRERLAGAAPSPAPEPTAVADAEPTEAQRPQLEDLHVEPDGTLVVEGKGEPGAGVSIYANGELVGTVTAEPSGSWTIEPDEPLPPGGTAITVGEADGTALAEEAYVVVVDPGKTDVPQVIPSTPEETAAVLLEVAPPLTELPPGGDTPEEPALTAENQSPPEPDSVGASPVPDEARPQDDEAVDATIPNEPEGEGVVVVPDAAERARREVAQALAHPHDVPSWTMPAKPAATPEQAAIERARREVALALTTPRDVLPSRPSAEGGADLVVDLDVVERAQQETLLAVEREREEAEKAQPEAAVPTRSTAPQAAAAVIERARREVALAIEAARTAAAASGTKPQTSPNDSAAGTGQREGTLLPPRGPAVAERARMVAATPNRRPPDPAVAEGPPREFGVPGKARLAAGAAVSSGEPPTVTSDDEAPPEARTAGAEPAAVPVPPPVDVSIHLTVPPPATSIEPPAAAPDETAAIGQAELGPAPPRILAFPIRASDYERLVPGRVVVRPGDTLWDIADRVYGDGYKYQTIYRANRHVIPRPGKLRPGQVLEVPLVFD